MAYILLEWRILCLNEWKTTNEMVGKATKMGVCAQICLLQSQSVRQTAFSFITASDPHANTYTVRATWWVGGRFNILNLTHQVVLLIYH